jgi:cobalt transporter subunit CbtB
MNIDPRLAARGESTGTAVSAAARQTIPAIVALLLGGFFLLGAGFAPVEAVHNAAHDTRHAFAFPCH